MGDSEVREWERRPEEGDRVRCGRAGLVDQHILFPGALTVPSAG